MYVAIIMLGRQKYHSRTTIIWVKPPEYDLAIEKLESHKSPGIDRISAERIKAGGKTFHNMKIDNSHFERVEEFKYFGITLTNQNSI